VNTQNLNSNFDNFDNYSSSISGPTEGSISPDQLAMEELYETQNNCTRSECTFPECRCDENTCCKQVEKNCGCTEGCMGDWDDDEDDDYDDDEEGPFLMGTMIIALGVLVGGVIGFGIAFLALVAK